MVSLAADHAERRGILHAQCGSLNTTWFKAFKKSAEKNGNPIRQQCALGQGEVEIPVRETAQNAAGRSRVFADLNRAEVG